jgi:CRISPR system Cascade subunit CasE
MILSRMFLNPAHRDVQRCLADAQALHRAVLSLFRVESDAPARAALGLLHRLELSEREGTVALLVQSREPADPSRLPPGFLDPRAGQDAFASSSLEALLSRLEPGRRFRFRLRANPTRRIDTKSGPDGKRRNGRRVPVRGDDGRRAWLVRKLEAAGFRLDEAAELHQRPEGLSRARRGGGSVAIHDAHTFEGVVQVVDARAARDAVVTGIGPAKAYGFGLLSLAPV